MASTTRTRASSLPLTATKSGGSTFAVVPNFAVFIDTHRDQPHVATFEADLGRLMRVEDGLVIPVDPKHRFVETSWWNDFVGDYVMEHGTSPVATSGDTQGQLPTSHLRNARAKVYKLKSLRQIVRAWEKASTTATGTVKPPSAAAKAAAKRAAKTAKAKSAAAALAAAAAGSPATTTLAGILASMGAGKPIVAPAKREPYTGPKVTDHEFTASSDDKLCWKPIRTPDGISVCAVPKEGHA